MSMNWGKIWGKIIEEVFIGEPITPIDRICQEKERRIRSKEVGDSYLTNTNPNENTNDIVILSSNPTNLNDYKEIVQTEVDTQESLNQIFSSFLGFAIQSGNAIGSVSGLLECNIPINQLYKISEHPELMRGFVKNSKGKFDQVAIFQEANIAKVAPVIAFQALSVITSQYYLHVITNQLKEISKKLDDILSFLQIDDQAKIVATFHTLQDKLALTEYSENDLQTLEESVKSADIMRIKYKKLLEDVPSKLDETKCRVTNLQEAKKMKELLVSSHFFDYFTNAIDSELLYIIANLSVIKAANYLGNKEKESIYKKHISDNIWAKYEPIYLQTKGKVESYIDMAAIEAIINEDEIKKLKSNVSQDFHKLQSTAIDSFDSLKIPLLLKKDNTGEIRIYSKK